MRSCYVCLFLMTSLLPPLRAAEPDPESVFHEPVRLMADGEIIDTGDAWGHSGPCLADVDGDGLRDLVVGDYSGKFRVYRNVASNDQPTYGALSYLMAGGVEAQVPIYCCIGSSPHFCDLDGDGHLDMISGSYDPGECYLFRGLGNGQYAARETIVDKNGDVVLRKPDQQQDYESFGSWVVTVDWDEDGDLDLLLGGFAGEMLVRFNEGTPEKPLFAGENVPVEIDGKNLEVPSGHAAPWVVDWDGDGRWDILSGSNSGAVYWYKNVGQPGAPRFEAARMLVREHEGSGYDELLDIDAKPVPGIRVQITAADYDGDGKVDLLVGDFCETITPKPDLSPAERAEMLAIYGKMKETTAALRKSLDALREEFRQRYPGDKAMSDEADAEWSKAYKAMRDSSEYKGLTSRSNDLDKSIKRYLAPPHPKKFSDYASCHGYVWLFRRK